MSNEDCIKGGAYFKDPGTLKLLTGNEPREVACCITDEGKFIWPQVKLSNGTVAKIVYSLWTVEEKAIYKQYRAHGSSKPKPAIQKPAADTIVNEESKPAQFVEASGSVASGKMLAYIRNCDKCIGVWNMDNVLHDLLTISGTNSYMPVPRSLIPKEDRVRLGIV